MPRTFADGLDVEVVPFRVLSLAWQEAREPRDREHVTLWIRNHPERFTFANHSQATDEGHLRWTLDRKDDLDFIRTVFGALYPSRPDFRREDVRRFLASRPELHHVNP
jgi:spore coat polysaccharide biosynthesis protein SpsF